METAIVLLVPEAEPLVSRWRALHDPSAKAGVPAHITLLFPFGSIDAAVDAALRALFAEVAPFEISVAFLRRFPGVLWLAPEEPAPLAAITKALVAAFPDYPPYGGLHSEITPHLTIADLQREPNAEAEIDRIERAFSAESLSRLPIRSHARSATLFRRDESLWRVHRTYPFGGHKP